MQTRALLLLCAASLLRSSTCEQYIDLCQQEAVQDKMPVFLTSGIPPKPAAESPVPSPVPSQGISEAPPLLEPYDEMESLLSRPDEVLQGSNREPEYNMNINIIMEVPSPVAEEEISSISDISSTQPPPQQQQLSITPTPIDQPSTSHNNIPRVPRPSYTSVQNRQRVWTTMVDDWHAPLFDRPLRVKKDYNNRHIPKDYFMDIFPDSILQMIAINTNKYAHEKGSRGWTDVSKEEISAYLGMIILMSINPVPDTQLYWSTDPFYKNPVICEVMPMKRYKKITENLHISDIATELPRNSPGYDKLCKVRPLIQKLNQTFVDACTPSQTQSIDESMIKFKGKSTMKQYMPKKPIKRGYKCWARCDSKSGYLYEFQFYSGKIGNLTEENLGYRVVLDLAERVPENTLLVFDNFFTSLGLMTALYEKKIFAVGTVRSNRKGLPEIIVKRSREGTLQPGEFIYQHAKPLSVFKWKDSKDVFVCTTAFDPTEVTVIQRTQKNGSKKDMYCPLAIKKYTEFMGGVDLFDHFRASYPLGKKSRKNWHRQFWFLLEAAVINSYIIYIQGCSFYPVGEYLKFVRIPENLEVGDEVLKVEVHPRKNLSLQPVDREEDAALFTYRDVNRTHVAVVLAQPVDALVDSDSPQNVVKFRLGCDYDNGDDLISAYLSVTVYIEDVNDNAPKFLDTPYRVTVDELTPIGLTIFKGIHAFDRDKPNTPNSDVQYTISAGDEAGHFGLESSHKPALVLRKPLDYDTGDREFNIIVTASDRGSPPRSTNATINVIVLDNDDLPPKFTLDVYKTQIPEFYPLYGKRIHKELIFESSIRAYDQDFGVGAAVRYDLISGNDRRLFALNIFNGTLFLEKEIDLDAETGLSGNTFVLQIQAAQVDNPLKTALARIEIEVLDLNDNLPEFEVDFYNISIVENLPNGFSVLQVMATDKDQGDNGEFTYQLNDPEAAFTIDPRTGWLTVRNQTVLDRERHASLKMKVYAKEKNPSVVGTFLDKQRLSKYRRNPTTPRPLYKDKTTYIFPDKIGTKNENIEYFEDLHQLMSFVTVEVTLLDANDNNPVFVPSNLYEFALKSNSKVGTYIGKVKAVDPDLGRNGMILFDLQRTSNLTITSPFQVDAKTGVISLAETPVSEGRHALFIEASDQPANPSERRYSLAVVTIDVIKASKGSKPEKPGFIGAPYEFWVGSNVGVGTSVGQIRINEAMEKNDVSYDLLHGYEEGVPFAVEESSGVITVIDELSRFNRPIFEFEAVASQENANVTISTNATVHIVDVNDERGVLLKGANSPIVFHVKENVAGATIGQIFPVNISTLPVNATGNIRFIIANQQDITDDIAIGEDGTIFAQKPLDREKRDIYRMTVIAEFTKGMISGAGIYQVTIHVDDENDNPPLFDLPIYEGAITENAKKGTEVKMNSKIRASDADADQNAQFMYTLFGDGHELFDVDENTGIVTFVGTKLDREKKGTYLLKIVARDKGSLSSEAKLTITVLDENDYEPKYNHITIPLGENIDLLEIDEKLNVKIFREKKNEASGVVINIEAKPKNKFALMSALGPLFSVPENVVIGSTILKVNAVDMDSGVNGQVRYEFISEVFMPPYAISSNAMNIKRYFVINERHGHIIVARALPPESEFRLNISAIDGGGLSDHICIRFFIKDVNDHYPVFKKSWYSFNVEEAQYTRRILGKIEATDADFGQNANLTYYIEPKSKDLPFEIAPLSGVFSVNGELDREKEDKYILTVVAKDNGPEKKLSSSVSVEVQVLDVNDNAPKFFAYDDLLEWKHPEAGELSNHNFESVMMIPVYKATVEENTPIGTTVARVYANDTDFVGNGNGLILYSLPQRKNQMNLFTIDSKEGIITTTGRLDYESQTVHNVTVVASDLGSPSLSSTAVLMLTVTDVPDDVEVSNKPVFISRYYELEIEENARTPVELLTLNLTEYYENYKMKYFILNENDSDVKRTFVIDPRNGTLYLVRSPDREIRDVYEIIIRAERQKISRELPHMIYPVSDDVLEGMSKFDVKVILRIKDVNDNAPKFVNGGRPMVTAIPTTAAFGYQVIQLQATDADLGVNADIRYQIINEQWQRFAIDPETGRVRAVAAFARDAGRVYGFDVKATDRKGADDGKSAIANVFVYVLDDNKQLVLVVGAKPMEVEKEVENITAVLTTMTGYDIRVRRLEANNRVAMDGYATDMYIYAVDPMSNTIIDMDELQKSLLKRGPELRQNLAGFKVLEVGDATMAQPRGARLLGTMEISAVALGCIVFAATLATTIAIKCLRTRRNRHKPYSQQRLNAFSTEHLTKYGNLFPSGGNQCQELNQSYSEADSYIDVINHNVNKKICPHGNTVEEFGKAHQKCIKTQFGDHNSEYNQKHEKLCIKYNQRPLQKRKGHDNSITSVNSSGQDSGIAEAARCPCGQSSVHTSEESSGCSYEDSLKSNHNQERKTYHRDLRSETDQRFPRRASFGQQPIQTRRPNYGRQSFSENIQRHYPPFERLPSGSRITRQISSPNVSIPQSYFMNKSFKRKEALNEPMVDYDQSDDDVFDTRIDRRPSKVKRGKFAELGGQAAVFVATPAAAEIMRRQGSERFMFARPL